MSLWLHCSPHLFTQIQHCPRPASENSFHLPTLLHRYHLCHHIMFVWTISSVLGCIVTVDACCIIWFPIASAKNHDHLLGTLSRSQNVPYVYLLSLIKYGDVSHLGSFFLCAEFGSWRGSQFVGKQFTCKWRCVLKNCYVMLQELTGWSLEPRLDW